MWAAVAAGFPWVAAGFPWVFFIVFGYFGWREKQRRLEMLHQERMAAIEKGLPMPEMPDLDGVKPWNRPQKQYPNAILVLSIVFLACGVGAMGALFLSPIRELQQYWSIPLPLALVGLGFLLYHFFARRNAR